MIWAVLLLAVGLGCIVAEVLFPSLGMLSLLATAAILGAVALAFGQDTSTGINFLIAVIVLVPLAVVLGFKVLPRSPLAKHLMLRGLSFESSHATDERDLALLGVEGVVESPLRPAGMARLAGRRVDVVSRGALVPEGTRVVVVEVRGNRVVVAPVEGATAPPATPGPSPDSP